MAKEEAHRHEADPAERLLVEAAQRDPRRFADLYELYFERIWAYVIRRVRDREDAQDITAEVFHNALRNLEKFTWRGSPFLSWLYRIAANLIADRARAHTPSPLESDPLASPAAAETEDMARLFRLVRRLPAEQQQVLTLRFVQEKSVREVAEVLGRSEGAIKQLQFRALRTLRERMLRRDP